MLLPSISAINDSIYVNIATLPFPIDCIASKSNDWADVMMMSSVSLLYQCCVFSIQINYCIMIGINVDEKIHFESLNAPPIISLVFRLQVTTGDLKWPFFIKILKIFHDRPLFLIEAEAIHSSFTENNHTT